MTLSICIESNQFIKEYKNLRQLTDALYMIARHACDFKIEEIIVLGEGNESLKIAAILQYFVTPKYLICETFKLAWKRGLDKNIFNEACKCKTINSLKFLKPWKRESNEKNYREGIAIIRKIQRVKKTNGKVTKLNLKDRTTEFVNVGLKKILKLENERVPFGVRVTVEVDEDKNTARLVSSKKAWGYCGYIVRGAIDVTEVFTNAGAITGNEGYSKVIGISNKSSISDKSNKLPDIKNKESVLIAVNTLCELWDYKIETISNLVADVSVAGIVVVATACSKAV